MSETSGAPARPSKGLIVNRGVTIVGSLSLQGDVVIEGAVDGEVRCTSVQIAERGVVDGLIVAAFAASLSGFILYWLAAELGLLPIHALGGEAAILVMQLLLGFVWAGLGYCLRRA